VSVHSYSAYDEFVDLASIPRKRQIGKHPFVERLRLAVPFDFIIVSGLDLDRYHFGFGQSLDTDLPPAFLEPYYAENLVRSDPLIMASQRATSVIIDEEVFATNPPSQRLLYLLRSFGVHNRILFPLRRGDILYGGVGFCRSYPFDREELLFLESIAGSTHMMVTKPIMDRFSAEALKLSGGEVICLRLASRGLTSEEISVESGYQPDTVNTYVKTATKKLGAKNRAHAIAEAIRRRLIE
jgi:DNA-binding CsgD family transcriptional regulator